MTPGNLPTVSVVMATYQRRERLPRAVDALLADPALTELVVVVDGCDDGTMEYLTQPGTDPRVRPIWQENTGASRAQQRGIEAATGEVVLMFDDDQIAGAQLAAGHARHHAEAERLVVCGYVPPAPLTRRSTFVEFGYATAYEEDCAEFELGSPVLERLWGGNLSLRRVDMLALGWSNPDFPHRYHYDWEFGLRCNAAGLTGRYDRTLFAEHEYVRSASQFRKEARAQGHALCCLEHLYPGLIGPDYLESGGRLGTRLQRLARRPHGFRLTSAFLLQAAVILHALGAYRRERQAGALLWAVEAQFGAREEAERLEASPAK